MKKDTLIKPINYPYLDINRNEGKNDYSKNIQCFYDAVNYLNISNLSHKNQFEYKLRKKTNNLFIIPEHKEEISEYNYNENSITDAQVYASENINSNNEIKSIKINSTHFSLNRSKPLIDKHYRSNSEKLFKSKDTFITDMNEYKTYKEYTVFKKNTSESGNADYLHKNLSKLPTNEDSLHNDFHSDSLFENFMLKEGKDDKERIGKQKQLKDNRHSQILMLESKNNAKDTILFKNTFVINNENIYPEIGKTSFNNSLYAEDECNSYMNCSRNYLNESLDDRKNKLLLKSTVSNDLSNNWEHSQQRIINKYDKSDIFNSSKSNKLTLNNDVSLNSCKSKNMSKFFPNHTLTQQINNKPEVLTSSECLSPQINSLFNMKTFSNKSLFDNSNCIEKKESKFKAKKKEGLSEEHTLDIENKLSIDNGLCDLGFIKNMIQSEKDYVVEPNFLLKHENIKVEYRSLLIDWIMELCEEFAYKRDTFHATVNYLDRYFSYCDYIEKDNLQLIGCICLEIAAKFEEVQIPKIEEYIKISEGASLTQFIEMEKQVLLTLEWRLIPTTIYTWNNWFMYQWDTYIDFYPSVIDKIKKLTDKDPIYFKKSNDLSYKLFRKTTQIIDLIVLDHNYYIFNYRLIIASIIFLLIAQHYNVISSDLNKLSDLNYLNLICFKQVNVIREVFGEFLMQSFSFKFQEIFLSIIYVSKFLNFEFSYELPLAYRTNDDPWKKGNYEDFLSLQTRNENNYPFIANYVSMMN